MYKSDYDTLLEKLNEFITKYYKNQLIRGILYATGITLVFYLAVALLEYYGQFDTVVRTVMFYVFVLSNAFVLTKLVIIPLLKLNKFGKIISNEEASYIIGRHFSNVQDKLLNILQLHSIYGSLAPESRQSALIEASIKQKIKEIKPIPFTDAINLGENKKYLKYALIPLLLFTLILFYTPAIITDSTERLIYHTNYFEKKAPFQFIIKNKEIKVPQQEDFLLKVKVIGIETPEDVFVNLYDNEYKMTREGKGIFSFLFKNVHKNIPFQLSADGFLSKNFELVVLPKPLLLSFSVLLSYPKYIGKKDEIIHNTGDLVIPAGTKVSWSFTTQNTRQLKLSLSDTVYFVPMAGENKFIASRTFLTDQSYSFSTSNEFLQNCDSVTYMVNVVPDVYPSIEVEEKKDSISMRQFYYAGNIKDDYGFTRLTFNYRFLKQKENLEPHIHSIDIPVSKNLTSQSFYYLWDMKNLVLSPGDELEYYFEVWDNDGVNGNKSTKSQTFVYRVPTEKEIETNVEKKSFEIKSEITESIQKAKELQKELEDLYRKILEKKNLSWEEKQKLEELLKKQKELEEKINNIKKDNEQKNIQQSEFLKPEQHILEKQAQLQKLMEEVMTDEMKKIFEEMQKLIDKMDKNKIQEILEKMQLSNKDIEKELDRTLEFFKRIEFDQKFEKTIEKLKELSLKQDELGNKTLDKKSDLNELKKQQDSLNKEFEDIKKDLHELEKKNSELEEPENIPDTKQQQEDIAKDMQNSSHQLNEGKKKNASQSQKSASQKMNQMAQQMQETMNQMASQQQEEDEHALRDILNNLIQLSFDQEALMKEGEKIMPDNPQYIKLSRQQKKLKDDAKMIEDSLFALSKRQPMIASVVNREISSINSNMDKSISLMSKREHRFTAEIATRQQFSMTSINNLALMLNEALDQMQKNCKSSKNGSCSTPGSCKKPGHGDKPSAGNLRKAQEQLKKQMEALKKSMEEGKQKGSAQSGENWSEQMVKIAAQQEALKQMLQQLQREGGVSPGDAKNMIKMMEDSQKDIVNRMLNEETIKRQQQILEKLLDYEKAEKERDIEQKRQANEAKDEEKRNFSRFFEYNLQKEKETELLKTIPPSFKGYYKNKVSEYFNNLANSNKNQ